MNRNVLAALTAAAVLVGFGIAAGAGAEGAPMAVLSALSWADGAQVSLHGVVRDKVVTDPPYVVVREPWSGEIRLIVLLDAPSEVQRWQTVDVTPRPLPSCFGPFVPENSEPEALAGGEK